MPVLGLNTILNINLSFYSCVNFDWDGNGKFNIAVYLS
jgi:hypothetical protein